MSNYVLLNIREQFHGCCVVGRGDKGKLNTAGDT
jgi:hypothetical protein